MQQHRVAGRQQAGRQLGISQLEHRTALPVCGEAVQLLSEGGQRVRRREEGRSGLGRQPVQPGGELAELAATSTSRAGSYWSSRRILRAMVSPGTRRMIMPAVPSPARRARKTAARAPPRPASCARRERRRLPVERTGLGRPTRRVAAQDQLGPGCRRVRRRRTPVCFEAPPGSRLGPSMREPGPIQGPTGTRQLVPGKGIGHPSATPFGAR